MWPRLLLVLLFTICVAVFIIPFALISPQTEHSPVPVVPPLSTDSAQTHTGMVVPLAAPLTTYTPDRPARLYQCRGIEVIIDVPEDSAADLGVGAYLKDQDGKWFQLPHPSPLLPGENHLYFPVALDAGWQSEPYGIEWNAYRLHLCRSYGLYFWSTQKQDTAVTVKHLRAVPDENEQLPDAAPVIKTGVPPGSVPIHILSLPGYDPQQAGCHVETGKRWELHCRPTRIPENPFDNKQISISAFVTGDNGKRFIYKGFYYQPIALSDAGDHEAAAIKEPGYFIVRIRPQEAGRYKINLHLNINGDTTTSSLPDLIVTGRDFHDYVRVDEDDKRFFKIGDGHSTKPFFPLGINLRSVTDSRGHENTPCVVTPNRGSLSYKHYLERFSRAGANCAEIWMCNWNLALEWRQHWPGYYGASYYNEANAERLDRILDMAYDNNIRVILVLNNHGQASSRVDSEWDHHPYNRRNGGFLRHAEELFTDPRALELQEQHRAYVVARYADHPAIMCWKLWTEQDLTDVGMRTRNGYRGPNTVLRTWHHEACDHMKTIDPYQHPVVTHWSTDYTIVDRSVAAVPALDAIFIDAYHHRVPGHRLLANLLQQSIDDPRRGLAAFNKPVLVTEFGGTPLACPEPQLIAEHLSGPWAALFSGHAGAPLLWWFEWVDQHDHWHPYRAVSAFLHNEDLRHRDARGATLKVNATQQLWSRAWARPGRVLGYILDYQWGYQGTAAPLIRNARVTIGTRVKAGDMHMEWWDASLGHIIDQQDITHTGGLLEIPIPDFRRHLAFKLYRY